MFFFYLFYFILFYLYIFLFYFPYLFYFLFFLFYLFYFILFILFFILFYLLRFNAQNQLFPTNLRNLLFRSRGDFGPLLVPKRGTSRVCKSASEGTQGPPPKPPLRCPSAPRGLPRPKIHPQRTQNGANIDQNCK